VNITVEFQFINWSAAAIGTVQRHHLAAPVPVFLARQSPFIDQSNHQSLAQQRLSETIVHSTPAYSSDAQLVKTGDLH